MFLKKQAVLCSNFSVKNVGIMIFSHNTDRLKSLVAALIYNEILSVNFGRI